MTTTITGHDAIAYAEARGLTLSKYADPTEGAREGLSVEDAREVASEDEHLIYIEAPQEYAILTGMRIQAVRACESVEEAERWWRTEWHADGTFVALDLGPDEIARPGMEVADVDDEGVATISA